MDLPIPPGPYRPTMVDLIAFLHPLLWFSLPVLLIICSLLTSAPLYTLLESPSDLVALLLSDIVDMFSLLVVESMISDSLLGNDDVALYGVAQRAMIVLIFSRTACRPYTVLGKVNSDAMSCCASGKGVIAGF